MLYDRLSARYDHSLTVFSTYSSLEILIRVLSIYRDYPDKKLQENLDAEIFGVLSEEARESYDEEVVVELKSETDSDIEGNCERIGQWIENWKTQNRSQADGS